MTRPLGFSLLTLVLVGLVAGCGTPDSSGDDPSEPIPPPLPVSAQEQAAITTLRELGVELDLDEAGHVRILELGESQATDDDLKLLKELPQLEALDISGGKITVAGLKHLQGLVGLQRLYLNDLPITNQSLAFLTNLTRLDSLALCNSRVSDAGMIQLKSLNRLRVINLAKTDISNLALRHIQEFRELDTLVVADTKVTSEGFRYLKPLKKLRVLNIDRCQDVSSHLLDLGELPELRMVYTHGCDLSDEEVKELMALNSKLAVFGD